MQKQIGIGVIGCGGRIRGVLKEIFKADTQNCLKITEVYDPDILSVEAMKNDFPEQNFKVASSYSELACSRDVDWVYIGSWNCFHAEHAIAALKAGKHIFCEKPLATTLEDCLAIRDAALKSDSIFAFGLVLRYAETYQKIHEILSKGIIGSIISMEFNETLGYTHGGYIHGNWRRLRKNAGTHLLEKCCHDYDIVNWLTQSIPVKAASFGGNDFFTPKNIVHRDRLGKTSDGKPAFQTWSDPHMVDAFTGEKDIVDNQVAILQYANGIRATFHTNCCAGIPERRIYICGTEGSLRANGGVVEYQRIGSSEEKHRVDLEIGDGHFGGDQRLAVGMVECMTGKSKPLAGVKEGLLSAVACFGVDQALDTGKVVDMHELWAKAGVQLSDYSAG